MKNSELIKACINKGMKFGNVDIESSPKLTWHYGDWNVNPDPSFAEVDTQITSIAYKSLNTGKTEVFNWDRPKGKYGWLKPNKDKRLLKKAIPVLNEFDVLIGQNHVNFDIRVINWRLNQLNMPALNNLIPIDTKVESSKVFFTPSNKLDYKSKIYGRGGKIKQDMSDCVAVAKGNVDCTIERATYNLKDVEDDDYVFWKEIDYYKLPKKLINMMKLYLKHDAPTFCSKCAASKQAKFDVTKVRVKGGFKYTCFNCDHTWKVEEK